MLTVLEQSSRSLHVEHKRKNPRGQDRHKLGPFTTALLLSKATCSNVESTPSTFFDLQIRIE